VAFEGSLKQTAADYCVRWMSGRPSDMELERTSSGLWPRARAGRLWRNRLPELAGAADPRTSTAGGAVLHCPRSRRAEVAQACPNCGASLSRATGSARSAERNSPRRQTAQAETVRPVHPARRFDRQAIRCYYLGRFLGESAYSMVTT